MDSFEELLERHRRVVEALVHYRIRDSYDAEDVLQEILITAYTHRDSLHQTESFKPWLLRIAQNKINDFYRRQAKRLDLPLEAAAETPAPSGLYGHEERQAIQDILSRLKDQDQQILYLYCFKDLPQEEIARRLGVPLGTVKSRLYYARKHFKEEYHESRTSTHRIAEDPAGLHH